MGITTRFVRLMKSDVHALLDHLEDPEAALRQAVREMEEAIAADDTARVEIMKREEQLERARASCEERLAEQQRQLDLCFDAGNDALARSIIKKRLEVENRHRAISKQREALTLGREGIERRLAEQREKLAGIIEKMQLFATAPTGGPEDPAENVTVTEDQVEIAFLEAKRQRAASRQDGESARTGTR